jgi:hypothetical protein
MRVAAGGEFRSRHDPPTRPVAIAFDSFRISLTDNSSDRSETGNSMVRSEQRTIASQLAGWRCAPVARWGLLISALVCAIVAALTCHYRFVGSLGPVRFRISNPLKAMALAIAALHGWCLLTPRLQQFVGRHSRCSLGQLWLLIVAIETGAMAVFGVVTIDLQWGWAAPLVIVRPRFTATAAFCLAVAFLLSVDSRGRRWRSAMPQFRALWRRWNWGARAVCLVVLLQGVGVTKVLLGYWEQTSNLFLAHEFVHSPQFSYLNQWNSSFDRLCADCRRVIPPDARVLYHGPTEGLVLAYEIYPRRVFMLPHEQRDLFHNGWCTDLWCRDMAVDPLDQCWKWDPPLREIPPPQFISEHGITYVVTYDNSDPDNCTIQAWR